jgi:hypothetical protein
VPELNGPLGRGNFLTTDGTLSSSEAIHQLSLDKEATIQLYRYTFILNPGQYEPAEDSLPSTRLVRPANGHIGFGIEYQNTVPIWPIGSPVPAE